MPTGTIPGCQFPEHHKSGGSGGGGWVPVLLAVVAVAWACSTSTAARLASDVVHVVLWTAGSLVAVSVTAAVVVVVRRRHRGRTHPGAPRIQSHAAVSARQAPAVTARPAPAIEAPAVHYHLHLHAPALSEHQQEHHAAAPLTSAQASAERSGDQASPIRP